MRQLDTATLHATPDQPLAIEAPPERLAPKVLTTLDKLRSLHKAAKDAHSKMMKTEEPIVPAEDSYLEIGKTVNDFETKVSKLAKAKTDFDQNQKDNLEPSPEDYKGIAENLKAWENQKEDLETGSLPEKFHHLHDGKKVFDKQKPAMATKDSLEAVPDPVKTPEKQNILDELIQGAKEQFGIEQKQQRNILAPPTESEMATRENTIRAKAEAEEAAKAKAIKQDEEAKSYIAQDTANEPETTKVQEPEFKHLAAEGGYDSGDDENDELGLPKAQPPENLLTPEPQKKSWRQRLKDKAMSAKESLQKGAETLSKKAKALETKLLGSEQQRVDS